MEEKYISTNFDGDKIITSYDEKKVWVILHNNERLFCKQTKVNEVETNLVLAKELSNKKMSISGNEFELSVPLIHNWDDSKGVLMMEYCDGTNLEFILRNKKTYNFGVNILNELLKFFIENGIYWIDFAPRNILIKDNKINIVDFEKGLGFYNDIKDYLRNHVYEEYGSFSFLKDRIYMPNEIFDIELEDHKKSYYIQDIGPKRIKTIAKLLGYKDYLTQKEYLQIIKTFIIAEEPKIINDEFVFPRVILEQILKDKNTNPTAFENYALEVIKINKLAGNQFVKEVGKCSI